MNKNSAGVEKYPVLILSGIEINHKYNSINSCVCVCVWGWGCMMVEDDEEKR